MLDSNEIVTPGKANRKILEHEREVVMEEKGRKNSEGLYVRSLL